MSLTPLFDTCHLEAVSCVALNDLIEETPTTSAANTPPVQRVAVQNGTPSRSPRIVNPPTQMRSSPATNNLASQAQQAAQQPPPTGGNNSQPTTPRK